MSGIRDIRGAIALVTGGSSGIGLAIARALAREGATVLICARDPDRLDHAVRSIAGGEAMACDVTDPAAVAAMLDSVRSRHGRLDILVSNTGRLIDRDFSMAPLPDAALEQEITANLTAHILLANRALPLLRASAHPALVFTGSGYGLVPVARAPLYSAAKAGLHAFVKALRLRRPIAGLSVIELIPPVVDTPATAHRNVAKVPPEAVAEGLLTALRRGREDVLIGQVRALPLLLRIAPRLIERRIGRT